MNDEDARLLTQKFGPSYRPFPTTKNPQPRKVRNPMHYKNGREAKIGDKVVHPLWHHNHVTGKAEIHPQIGTVMAISPGSKTCNAAVWPITHVLPTSSVTLSDCVHVDDVAEVRASAFDNDIVTSKPTEPEPVTLTDEPAKDKAPEA